MRQNAAAVVVLTVALACVAAWCAGASGDGGEKWHASEAFHERVRITALGAVPSAVPGIVASEAPLHVELVLTATRTVPTALAASSRSFRTFPPLAWHLLWPLNSTEHLTSFAFSHCGGRWRSRWGPRPAAPQSNTSRGDLRCGAPTLSVQGPAGESFDRLHRRAASTAGAVFASSFGMLVRAITVPRHRRPVGAVMDAGPRAEERVAVHSAPGEHFCTQHLAQVISQFPGSRPHSYGAADRRRRDAEPAADNYPAGLARALLPPPPVFFACPYHAMRFVVREGPGANDGGATITMTAQLSLEAVFATAESRAELVAAWAKAAEAASPRCSPHATSCVVDVSTPPGSASPASGVRERTRLEGRAAIDAGGRALLQQLLSSLPRRDAAVAPTMPPHAFNARLVAEGEVRGELVLDLRFPPSPESTPGAVAVMLVLAPSHVLAPAWSSLDCAAAGNATLLRPALRLRFDPATSTHIAHVGLQLRAAATGRTVGSTAVRCRVRYVYPTPRSYDFPPDANRAFTIPQPVVLFGTPSSNRGDRAVTSAAEEEEEEEEEEGGHLVHLRAAIIGGARELGSAFAEDAVSWGVAPFLSSTEGLVTSLPAPDVSMPFNALAVGMSFFVLLFGAVFAMTVRNEY